MKNEEIVKEWRQFAEMDFLSAAHLFKTMRPIPYEIICYHCQQATEKNIKAIILSKSGILQKTHDLGLLLDLLSEKIEIPEGIYDSCDNLTPYGVKARYPQELYLEEKHAQKTLADAEKINEWCSKIFL